MTGSEFRGVDVNLLADYIGGVLDGTPDESVVATLIADDLAWRAAYETLSGGMASVTAELGRFEAEPMPDDVAARLDAALAAAPPPLAVVRSTESEDETAPAVREKKSSRKLRWVTPIAVAAGAVAFVGFGLDYLAGRDGSSTDSSYSTAGGQAESDKGAAADSGAANSAQAPALAPDRASGSVPAPTRKLEVPPGPQLLASGMNYSKKTLGEAVSSTMASSADAYDKSLARLRVGSALQDCLDMIAAANGGGHLEAESVDFARYNGKPAIVVRFTSNGKSWAVASGPACGTLSGGADTLAKVPVR
ncbi:hypothetical protein ACQP2F_46330 [Actinoplanes sp. CA-030573]|uniref:hypothetical protein n=1 Tax=Actinoplanes sp. CA-030573 TaxID=3239898 RepID=UPI003D8A3C60